MRYLLLIVGLVAVLSSFSFSAEDGKPNLLFIYLDDFGWRDTGYMGSDFYETPNIDKLSETGMIFTNAYSAASNCAPARASLMSGQYTPRHRIFNVGTGPRGKAKHRRLLHIPGTDTLDPAITTWAQCLQKAGYYTATMGKWHLSNDPVPHGFDVNIGGSHSGGPPAGYYPPHPKAPVLKDISGDEYLTDTLSRHAESFVREQSDRSWALYLTHFAVHTPLDPKKEYVDKYKEKKPGTLHNHVAMATMIEAVDEGVGRIVAALEETKTRDKTIIVFSSDNGGYGPATDMDPLKGYKGAYYEGGIRVPLFVSWPGVVKPGAKNDTPVIGVDIYPTICEMLGVELPTDQELDGKSLVPLLKGEETDLQDRALFWHFPAYLQSYGELCDEQRDPLFRSRPCSIIRKGDWKLHQYFEDGGLELYNLNDDIGESRNVADEHPEVLQSLKRELESWRESTGAPVPIEKNPEFDADEESRAIRSMKKGRKKRSAQ